jgi:hypothetical protein
LLAVSSHASDAVNTGQPGTQAVQRSNSGSVVALRGIRLPNAPARIAGMLARCPNSGEESIFLNCLRDFHKYKGEESLIDCLQHSSIAKHST